MLYLYNTNSVCVCVCVCVCLSSIGGQTAGPIMTKFVTHLDETSHMSAEFVFRYGPKCMGGLILPILVLLHL